MSLFCPTHAGGQEAKVKVKESLLADVQAGQKSIQAGHRGPNRAEAKSFGILGNPGKLRHAAQRELMRE